MKREKKRKLNYEIDGSALYFSFFFIPTEDIPMSSVLPAKRGIVTGSPTTKRKCNAFAILPFRYSKKNKKTFLFEQGTSLLETVLYIGIFAVITILTVNTILALTRAVGEIREVRHTIRDADIAMERMIREIRATESVNTTASVLGSHPGKLVLTGTSSTITFSLLGGKQLFLKKGMGSPASLTSSSTAITNLVFTHFVASSSEAVRVRMTMDNKNFYGTTILRGSYK